MTNEEQNWENTIDWDRFDPPAGGRAFFDNMKASIPQLDKSIAMLRTQYETESGRIARQAEVMKIAERLQKEFDAISESEAFRRVLNFMDTRVKLIFPRGEIPTIGEWLRWGGHITRALRNGSLLPDEWKKDRAKAEHELVTAETLRRFVALYVSVCEADYRLRYAPIRLRTKMFREISRDVSALVTTGEALDREQMTEAFVSGFWTKAKEILEIARKSQKACRQMRKTIDRIGERYWRETADFGLVASA